MNGNVKYLYSFFLLLSILISRADSLTIKVFFLYGSKPKKEFKAIERKSFGGILGGHVGLGINEDSILNFLPYNDFHLVTHKNNKASIFHCHKEDEFWSVLGVKGDVKGVVITIPVSIKQLAQFKLIKKCYTEEVPYDYAFLGMRCAASTYEILAQLGVLKQFTRFRTSIQVFYPKRLRKQLLKLAEKNNWHVRILKGSITRKWEKD